MFDTVLNVVSDSVTVQLFITLFLGLALGSFSTAIIYRTRQNQSWIWNDNHKDKGRSFCPSCKNTLKIKDLIPILSWLFQRGHCRYCNVKIPLEYIFLETAVIFACLLAYGAFGFTKQGVFLMFLMPFFVSQAVLIIKYNVLSKLLLSIIAVGGVIVLFL